MKISEVNNTRSAVAGLTIKKEGKLYQVKSGKEYHVENLESRINYLLNSQKRLYSIFNTKKLNKEAKKKAESNNNKKSTVNKDSEERQTIQNLAFKASKLSKVCKAEELLRENTSYKIIKEINNLTEDELQEVLQRYLKKSLNYYHEEAFAFFNNYDKDIEQLDEETKEKVKKFKAILDEDYNRKRFKKNIIKSIKNQNMPFQPYDGKIKVPVGEDNLSTALDISLSLFADLNKNERNKFLIKIRYLIELYFMTPHSLEARTINGIGSTLGEDDLEKIYESLESINKDPFVAHQISKQSKGNFITEIPDNQDKEFKTISRMKIRDRNILCYRYSMATIQKLSSLNKENILFDIEEDNIDLNKYWIKYIQDSVEKISMRILRFQDYKFTNAYLKEQVWKDIINYLSITYVALGKAVYNFSLSDIKFDETDLEIAELNQDFLEKGITSFDYEMIKANESLQRNIATAIAFSSNNLSRAIIELNKASEDILLLNKDNLINNLIDFENGPLDAVLMFFGGKSQWEKTSLYKKISGNQESQVDFILEITDSLSNLRNLSFHFKSLSNKSQNKAVDPKNLVYKLFVEEVDSFSEVLKDKYYSNNTYRFYQDNFITEILEHLYERNDYRPSQVPSFNKIMPRSKFSEILASQGIIVSDSNIDRSIWESSLYFILKEIYYLDFLNEKVNPNYSKNLFMKSVKKMVKNNNKGNKKDKNFWAKKQFIRTCRSMEKLHLGQICQAIMTEYNLQNNNVRKVLSSNDNKQEDLKFKHYKILLHENLQNAFFDFVKNYKVKNNYLYNDKNNKLRNLFKPMDFRQKDKQDFLVGKSFNPYTGLINILEKDDSYLRWYVLGRFLNPKVLNHLIGHIKSYIQFVEEIKDRASGTKSSLYIKEEFVIEKLKNITLYLEFCMVLSAKYSNEITDYFKDEEDYADFINKFVNYDEFKNEAISDYSALRQFCGQEFEIEDEKGSRIEKLGFYTDAYNPISNRNIIQAKLYSPYQLLSDALIKHRIETKDFEKYYRSINKNVENMAKNTGKDPKIQKQIMEFNYLKNKLEFRNLVEYGELMNDLLAQLINWTFIRERDLLYFQLGFHYKCLDNNSEKPEEYKVIEIDKGIRIINPILYQIMGMYIWGTGIFQKNKKGLYTIKMEKASTATKLMGFVKYSDKITEDYKKYGDTNKWYIYTAGLELFENINEHESIINLRNYIDHFHYYLGEKSLLDLYSLFFEKFFDYDMKYRKNVPNMLTNILQRYKLNPKLKFESEEDSKNGKPMAKITIRELESDKYIIKGQKEKIDFNNGQALDEFKQVLNYKISDKSSNIDGKNS